MEIGHLFQGHALNAVDAKGRVSVPASFRALIEKRALGHSLDPDNTLMIGEHANGACLTALDAVASSEIDVQLREGVAELPAAERMAALEAARVDAFGSLESVKFDGAGRMVLSPMLRALGEIEDLAYFVGAGSSFQIWNPKKALAAFPEGSRNRKTLAFLLREKGIAA
ncbi:MAG TPA: division/cell wall cluster transcriptional repressor MraZ [Sphingomonas sp.]|nr:division/cell wall cluster transcriptional repressor MraZ [Sphingomonas sp.]